jgi:hypothetical protein
MRFALEKCLTLENFLIFLMHVFLSGVFRLPQHTLITRKIRETVGNNKERLNTCQMCSLGVDVSEFDCCRMKALNCFSFSIFRRQ